MTSTDPKAREQENPQRLHLVFGGELKSLESHEFRDPSEIEIVGLFPDYASAERAWRAKAQATVDSAQTRYYHRPSASTPGARPRPADPDRLSASCRHVRAGRGSRRRRSASCWRLMCASFSARIEFTTDPADIDAAVKGETPLIVAMWHGQHLMLSFAWPDAIDRMAALVSRHEDAGAQAAALEHLGVTPVRGSGGPADRAYYKGGAPAMRELLRQLEVRRSRSR